MALIEHPPVVLLYHRMGSCLVRSTVRGQYVLPAFFRTQLRQLAAGDWRAVPLQVMLANPDRHARCFAVTFDDGYASVGRLAWPILRESDVPVTIFVVAGEVGGDNRWDQRAGDRCEPLLDAVELREMAAAGVEIGSHTLSHPRLTTLPDAALQAEIADSKHLLEDLLGVPVSGFSYPYGDMDARVRDVVINAGYRYAVATTLGVVNPAIDPFAVPRINIRWNTVGPLLGRKLRRAIQHTVVPAQ